MEAEDIRRRSEALRPIRIAKQYVQEHYSQSITLEDVCAATGFSVSYFSALFKKESGEGFSKYLTGVRMEHAKELLQESSLPVTEVCARVGYSDLKHFTQIFKKYTSLSHPVRGGGNRCLWLRGKDRKKAAAEYPKYVSDRCAGRAAVLRAQDRKSTRLNSSHDRQSRMPSSA